MDTTHLLSGFQWTQPVLRVLPWHVPMSSMHLILATCRLSKSCTVEQMIPGLSGIFKRLNTALLTIFPCCKHPDWKTSHHVNITCQWALIHLMDVSAGRGPNFRKAKGVGTSVRVKEIQFTFLSISKTERKKFLQLNHWKGELSLCLFDVLRHHLLHPLQLFFQPPCSHERYAFTTVSIFSWHVDFFGFDVWQWCRVYSSQWKHQGQL